MAGIGGLLGPVLNTIQRYGIEAAYRQEGQLMAQSLSFLSVDTAFRTSRNIDLALAYLAGLPLNTFGGEKDLETLTKDYIATIIANPVLLEAYLDSYVGWDAVVNTTANATIIASAATRGYIEATNPLIVPLMTSNTAPSGVASASHGDATAFRAFNRTDGTFFDSGAGVGTNVWLQYEFTVPVKVNMIKIGSVSGVSYNSLKNFKMQYLAKDGITWVDASPVYTHPNELYTIYPYLCSGQESKKWRAMLIDTWGGGRLYITQFQMYGR